jgi:hypothetical protein
MQDKSVRAVSAIVFAIVCLGALSPRASAEAVTLSDLEGIAVEADVHREQTVRRKDGTASMRIHQNWKFSVTDETVEHTIQNTTHGPRGTRKAEPNSGTFMLGESREVASRGGGEAVWTFADGTLTFVRTFPSGAYRANFAFSHGPSGLTCSVTAGFAREDGKGEIRLQSPFGGGEVTILSSKQLPSTCKVSKKP